MRAITTAATCDARFATAYWARAALKPMPNGGAWLGFHAAAYNDGNTKWPWFVDFLGGGVFRRNNWPPQSAKPDDRRRVASRDEGDARVVHVAAERVVPVGAEPARAENVKVLVTLSPENYPLGFKDTVTDRDFPVVWSNTDYNMVYMNMGHGERIFVDPTQNYLIYNAVRWLMRERFE